MDAASSVVPERNRSTATPFLEGITDRQQLCVVASGTPAQDSPTDAGGSVHCDVRNGLVRNRPEVATDALVLGARTSERLRHN